MRRGAAGLVLAAVLATGAAGMAARPAGATCADEAETPALTLVDRLFDADAVAIAAANPADPARWRLVATPAPVSVSLDAPDPGAYLAAGADGAPPPLGAEEVVLFTHDPVDAQWRRLGSFDQDGRSAVEGVLEAAKGWEGPLDPARFQFAARMLGAQASSVRTLALQDLDGAPYETLRSLRLPLDAEALIRSLAVAPDARLEPIHALLIGLSGGPRARALIGQRIGALAPAAQPTPAQCAWAVALVEIDGAAGLETLTARFLRADPVAWPAEDMAPMIEALAIQAGAGSPGMRRPIIEALEAALDARPDLMAPVARSFTVRGDWAMGPAAQAALKRRAGLPAADALIAASYVFAARKSAQSGEAGAGGAAWGGGD